MFTLCKMISSSALLALCISLGAPALPALGAVSLKDTVKYTLDYNPTVKSFQEYRQAARHDLQRARSDWFPRVDARAGYGTEQWNDAINRGGRPAQSTSKYYERHTSSIVVSQIIWDGMATWNRVTLNEQRLDSARTRLFDNAEALSLDAVLAHIEVFRQRQLLQLADLNVNNHKQILASQRERQVSGASTMADVTQTESRLARTEASKVETRSALEVAIANYQRLTGRDPNNIETPSTPASAYPSLEVALLHGQVGNLKIRTSQHDLDAARTQIELDKAPFHPTITLDWSTNYNWQVQSSRTWEYGNSLMLNLNWNLFRGGYDSYNVKGDKARARQAKRDLQVQQDLITEETTSTWSQYMSARDQARFFADAVNYSTKTRDMYLEQFNVGQRSLLDVLDAENEVFTSAIQLVTAQQNVIAAQFRLLALGGELLANFDIDRNELVINTDNTGFNHR